jgi:hypothetical protein
MDLAHGARPRSALTALRAALVVFVLAWLFGPYALRSAVPIWVPFFIALGLELQFFLGARRETASWGPADRLPQAADRERYGYGATADELLLVERGSEQVWIPYAGETGDELEELIAEADATQAGAAPPARSPVERPRGRPLRQLGMGLAVLAALAAIVWLVGDRGGWEGLDADRRAEAADRFSALASRVAGHPVTIRCDESGDFVGAVQHADGVAAIGGGLAYLAPERCFDLYRLAFRGEVTFSQTARALAVLAHEAWHLRGVRDEGTTECYALQSGVELGQRLGLSEARARQMMRQQLAENALRAGSGIEYVVPAECRDGGRLDLNPGASAFP